MDSKNYRNEVPEFKKGLGSVSVVIFSEDFKSFIGMHDFEKSSPGKQRFALPGGTKEISDHGDALCTALRETEEEMGHRFAPKDLVQIPYLIRFENESTKDFFVALLPPNTPLRNKGTRQVIQRFGKDVDMEVLGPPTWILLDQALKLPPRGTDPQEKFYLHLSHLRGLIEAIFFLKGKPPVERLPAFREMWSTLFPRISGLRRELGEK